MKLTFLNTSPAFKLMFFYIAGLIIGRYTNLNPVLTFIIFVALFIAATLMFCGNISLANYMLIAAVIVAGILIYNLKANTFQTNHVVHCNDLNKRLKIAGKVVGFPDYKRDRVEVELALEQLISDKTTIDVCGNILLKIKDANFFPNYGDRLTFEGKIVEPNRERNPGEFNYKQYLAANNIHGLVYIRDIQEIKVLSSDGKRTVQHAVQFVKSKLYFAINDLYGEKTRPLVKGLLLGERGEISSELRNAFAKSGVIHALAISGLHIGYISIIFYVLFSLLRFSYQARIIAVLLSIFSYNLLIGFEPPTIRASLMGGLFLIGRLIQKPTDILNIISAAALIILLVNPLELFQASFQLSFCAVISIIYIYQRLRIFFEKTSIFRTLMKTKFGEYVGTLFLVSMAAQLGTLPIVVYYFHRIPVIAIVLNLIVIPLVGVVIALGFATIFFSFFSVTVAQLYAHTNTACLNFLIMVIEGAEKIKYVSFETPSIHLLVVFTYYFLLWLILNIEKKVYRKALVYSLLIAVNVGLFHVVFADNKWLEVVYFDVGQGDAALVTFPDGKRLLIDAGPNLHNFDAGSFFLIPYFKREGINRLNTVVLSHADNDHIGGMPTVLRSLQVERIIDTGLFHDSRICSVYSYVVDSLKSDYSIAEAGVEIGNSDDYGVFILHPGLRQRDYLNDDINNNSVVLKICYGDVSFLFTGDVENEAEELLLNYGNLLQSSVLKVAHHGSKTSSISDFLKLVNPEYAVISLGKNNKFKFPSALVLDRLNKLNVNILRTDENGAIIFKTDGKRLTRVR